MIKLSELVFALIQYRNEIFRWHSYNKEMKNYSLNEEGLYKLIKDIYEKSGIIEITPELGTQYDQKLHQVLEKVIDPGQPHEAICKVITEGYQIKWTQKIIRKAGVQVNYIDTGNLKVT